MAQRNIALGPQTFNIFNFIEILAKFGGVISGFAMVGNDFIPKLNGQQTLVIVQAILTAIAGSILVGNIVATFHRGKQIGVTVFLMINGMGIWAAFAAFLGAAHFINVNDTNGDIRPDDKATITFCAFFLVGELAHIKVVFQESTADSARFIPLLVLLQLVILVLYAGVLAIQIALHNIGT